jgi:hypothetical protein
VDAVQRKQARNSCNANHNKGGKNNDDRRSRGPIEPTINSQLNGRAFRLGSIDFFEFDIRHRLNLVLSSSAQVIHKPLSLASFGAQAG